MDGVGERVGSWKKGWMNMLLERITQVAELPINGMKGSRRITRK